MRRIIAVVFAVAVATSVSVPGVAQTAGQPRATVDHVAFDAIVRQNVHEENVDYLNIRHRHWRELGEYLNRVAQTDVGALSRDEQLALYINLYNATVIHAVIERFKAGYSVSDNNFSVFNEPLVRLKGRTVSLNDLENKVIRPMFQEPRIHVALVCGARSCPPLLPRAYQASDLSAVLEENMRRFVNDPSRNRLHDKGPRLYLSRIFDWYTGDFGGKDALTKYLAGYTDVDVAGGKIRFLEYSWALNIAPPREGAWVTVTAKTAQLRSKPGGGSAVGSAVRNQVFNVLEEKNDWIHIEQPFKISDAWIERRQIGMFRVTRIDPGSVDCGADGCGGADGHAGPGAGQRAPSREIVQ